MFCDKCGKQINEGANFCRFCGARFGNAQPAAYPVQTVPAQPVAVDSATRQQELDELEKALQFAEAVWPRYRSINEQYAELNRLERLCNQKDVLSRVLFFVGLGVGGYGLIMMLAAMVMWGSGGLAYLFLVVIGLVLAGVAKFVIAPSRQRQFRAREEDYNRVEAAVKQESAYLQEFQASPELRAKAEYYGKYFPNDDMDEKAVAYVLDLIKTGRCDSFKEAINLYDTHMYQQKQENIRVAMLEEQQKTTKAARSTARAAGIAAAAASVCAINSFYRR